MIKPKLIILNGFAGSGKSTIGKKYMEEHPLALLVEGDELIVNIGQWLKYENEARSSIFELTKSLVATHLANGHDVVLPYLVTDNDHLTAFREIAQSAGADYFNFLLYSKREMAIAQLLKRGTWGEKGLDLLSEKDMPEINDLYDRMKKELESQKDVIQINQRGHTAEKTYAELLSYTTNS